MAQQMASAFEEQAAELETIKSSVSELHRALSDAANEAAELRSQLDAALREVDFTRATANKAEAKTIEIERRADEIRRELDHAHQLSIAANENRAAEQLRSDRAIEGLRAEIRKVKDNADLECAKAQAALTSAIATAARLSGQIETLTIASSKGNRVQSRRKSPPGGQPK